MRTYLPMGMKRTLVLQQNLAGGPWPLTANGNDTGPNALHLTGVGSPTFDSDGVHLNGTSQHLKVADSAALRVNGQDWFIYLEAVAEVAIPNDFATLLSKYTRRSGADPGAGFFVWQLAADPYGTPCETSQTFSDQSNARTLYSFTSGFSLNTRFTLATGYDGTNQIMSLNGVTQTPGAASVPTNETGTAFPLVIGAEINPDNPADIFSFWRGTIRKLVIWIGDISAIATADAIAFLRNSWDGTYNGLADY